MCRYYPGYWAYCPGCENTLFYKQDKPIQYNSSPQPGICGCNGKEIWWHIHGFAFRFRRYCGPCRAVFRLDLRHSNAAYLDAPDEKLDQVFKKRFKQFYPRTPLLGDSNRSLHRLPAQGEVFNPCDPPLGWNGDAAWNGDGYWTDGQGWYLREGDETPLPGSPDTKVQFSADLQPQAREDEAPDQGDEEENEANVLWYEESSSSEPAWADAPDWMDMVGHEEEYSDVHQSGFEVSTRALDTPSSDTHDAGFAALGPDPTWAQMRREAEER